MKKGFIIIFICCLGNAFAQNVQKDINDQVWKPFTTAIMMQDVNAFVILHSNDLVRAERNGKKVLSLKEYKKNMETSWPRWKESNQKNQIKYTFELRFTERITNGSLAYEVGYFKNESVKPSGDKQIRYGKFQVALRKENGVWKILVDSDSNEGNTISEKDFLEAAVME
jgi:ketosteroid isomerase-like protein